MFLVPYNKKRIFDSAEASPKGQTKATKTATTDRQSFDDKRDSPPINNRRQLNLINHHQQQLQQQPNERILTFLLSTTNLVGKTLIESLLNIKGWLHISLSTLLAILSSIGGYYFNLNRNIYTNLLFLFGGHSILGLQNTRLQIGWRKRPDNHISGTISQVVLTADETVVYLDSTGGIELDALEAKVWKRHSNWQQKFVVCPNSGILCNSDLCPSLYYFCEESLGNSLAATTNNTSTDFEMDFCRRKVAQRAPSHNAPVNGVEDARNDVGPSANSTSYYWDCLPAAISGASASISTSVGPQVSLAGYYTSTGLTQSMAERGELQHEQQQKQMHKLGTRASLCQGQPSAQHKLEHPEQSYGPQLDTSISKLVDPRQQQNHFQRCYQTRDDGHSALLKGPKYTISPGQLSQSSNTNLMSNIIHLQNKQQDNLSNGPMNFNPSHISRILSQSELQRQQKTNSSGQADGNGLEPDGSMILVSKTALSNLTDQIALSMNKMKDLEAQVRIIPDIQRRLDNVISDTNNSSSSTNSSNKEHKYQYFNRYGNNTANVNGFSPLKEFRFTTATTEGSATTLSSNNDTNGNSSNQQQQQQHQLGNNLNKHSDDIFKGIHPSLQRHYNSFKCSTPRAGGDCFERDAAINNHSSPGHKQNFGASPLRSSFNIRSPNDIASRIDNFNHHHGAENRCNMNQSSRQSLPVLNNMPSQINRSHQSVDPQTNYYGAFSNNTRSNSPKVEYEELINDLISLSYSVNYPSSNSNSMQSQSSRRSQVNELATNGTNFQHNHQNVNQSNNHGNNKRTSSFVGKLDCGCQTFKEHLRYNSMNLEQRLNHARSQSMSTSATSGTGTSNRRSPQPSSTTPSTPIKILHHQSNSSSNSNKVDASTNTDLSMDNIVTRQELSGLVTRMQASYADKLQETRSREEFKGQMKSMMLKKASSFVSDDATTSSSSSGRSLSGPKSSSPLDDSPSDSCKEDEDDMVVNGGASGDVIDAARALGDNMSSDEMVMQKKSIDNNDDNNNSAKKYDDVDKSGDGDEDVDDEEEEDDDAQTASQANSLNGQEDAYSLGSSYQDPSDFEEYCAYGESLDRRTKDFMSHSTKIPHDLRFALIRLNDFIKRQHSFDQIAASSGCIEVIRKEWFEVAASKDSQPVKVKLYVDYFESFTKQLLNTVVNLSDSAGNTAIHYAASHYKLDIIDVLLQTKVCDLNCRNKAGYTPIMLLALAEITSGHEQEIARHLFSMGDVNIKARSNGQTALMLAASHGRLATCKLLLECGADPSLQDYDGSTALMCGSENGHEQVVKCLLAHRLTDPSATDNDGLDALKIAMNNGHKSIGLVLYAAQNVPRMVRSNFNSSAPLMVASGANGTLGSVGGAGYLGASLRRSRGRLATNYVRRADSLLGSRSSSRLIR